ncbi:MAG TPA: histone deacetylase [Gemmatimonadaceae bacterium]|nr:histone deacetylase [Gemmatimonadaceae bacterium]
MIPLPAEHRFPISKYALLRDAVVERRLVAQLHEPARADTDDLLRVHTPGYVARFTEGSLSAVEQRRVGFPWSPHLVERAYRAVGGTCEAAEAALSLGVTINLAGGTHHAFADHGEGFCVFNDVAVAIHRLLGSRAIRKAAIVDLDVHQGNGTHAIFAGDDRVFTFSMHAERNYPFHKVPGSLDIALDDGTRDGPYLERLALVLPQVLQAAEPDLVMYLAGADPLAGDRLGRLSLTLDGLARRDALVLQACREVGIPIAITVAGGYGRDIANTVVGHIGTVEVAGHFC